MSTPCAGDELPSAGEVLAAYVQALGGEEVVAGRTSMVVRGRFEMAEAGVSGTFAQYSSAAEGYRMTIEIPGVGSFEEGVYNGMVWATDPLSEARLLEGSEASAVERRAVFPAEVRYGDMYRKMWVDGVVEFQGRSCYRLSLIAGVANARTEYFDVETGLLVGAEYSEPGPEGTPMAITSSFGDYREFDGQMYPARTVQVMPVGRQEIFVESVEFDAVDPSDLVPPPGVASLMESSG
jgi:hypothetical protein